MRADSLNIRLITALLTLALLINAVPVVFVPQTAKAAHINNQSILIGSSAKSEVTTHDFTFEIPSSTSLGSIVFEYCSNTPSYGESCSASSGLDASSATLAAQTGETGFSIHGSSTSSKIILTRTAVVPVGTPKTITYDFDGVTNPNTNGTYFVRISTHSSTDGTGTPIDSGGVAFAIVNELTLTALISQSLTFCVARVVNGLNCSNTVGDTVKLGKLDETRTGKGTSQMYVESGSSGGYTISAVGGTLTSGKHVINRLNTKTSSQKGKNQFGFNLVDNSNPNVGTNPVGPGTSLPTSNYNTVNKFRFKSGDNIVTSASLEPGRKFTHAYIANVKPNQPVGRYSTTISYICLANF